MKLLICISIFILISSCSHNQLETKDSVCCNSEMTLSPLIDSLLKGYISENKGTFYVVYFDKKDDMNYRVTFVCSRQKIKTDSILYLNKIMLANNIPVFLYSGLEDFIMPDKNCKRKLDSLLDWGNSLSFIHTTDSNYIVNGDSYPFMNMTLLPTMKLSPPPSVDKAQ